MRGIRAIKTDNKDVDNLQRTVQEFSQQLILSKIIDGVVLSDIALTSGSTNIIEHPLSRPILGWMLVGNSTDCRVWDSQSTNNDKDKFIYLNTSANTTISLWIF